MNPPNITPASEPASQQQIADRLSMERYGKPHESLDAPLRSAVWCDAGTEWAHLTRPRYDFTPERQNLIAERDRWRRIAEEKIAMRREIEEALGIEHGAASEKSLAVALEKIRDLQAKSALLAAGYTEGGREA